MSIEPLSKEELEAEAVRRMWSKAPVAEDWQTQAGPPKRNGHPVIPAPINQVLIQLTEQQEASLQLLALLETKIAGVLAEVKDIHRLREVDTGGLLKGDPKSMENMLPSSPLIRGLFLEVGQRIEHQRHINGLIKTLAERVEL